MLLHRMRIGKLGRLGETLAAERRMPELFERLMVAHYDPAYARSIGRNFPQHAQAPKLMLDNLDMPSLLNEAPVFSALHDACIDLGDADGAKDAIARGMGPLARRLVGLTGTPYAKNFLTDLPQNAALLANAEQYGLVPPHIAEIFGQGAG